MDQPGLDRSRHLQALRGLKRINLVSGSCWMLWTPIQALSRRYSRPLRVLDIATGSGDVPLQLWRKAGKSGVKLAISGCDISETAIEYARRCAEEKNARIEFFCTDILSEEPRNDYDIVISSLFLHHLAHDQAVAFLRKSASLTRRLLLVSDLHRCTAGLILAYVATRLLTTSSVVHTDGPLSVRAAFTLDESRQLADAAGLEGVTIARRWPCRFLMSWERRLKNDE